jgi:ABC-type transport system substrate-binding protein
MRARALAVLIGVAMLVAFGVSVVSAATAQADTVVVKGVTDSFVDVNPCTGDAATITLTYNAVVHVATLPSGEVHFTSTLTGDVVLEPLDPALPTYTGHLLDFSNQIYNANEDVATFTMRARVKGSDGSVIRFGVIAHVVADTVDVSTDPPTTTGLKVTFLRFSCVS